MPPMPRGHFQHVNGCKLCVGLCSLPAWYVLDCGRGGAGGCVHAVPGRLLFRR